MKTLVDLIRDYGKACEYKGSDSQEADKYLTKIMAFLGVQEKDYDENWKWLNHARGNGRPELERLHYDDNLDATIAADGWRIHAITGKNLGEDNPNELKFPDIVPVLATTKKDGITIMLNSEFLLQAIEGMQDEAYLFIEFTDKNEVVAIWQENKLALIMPMNQVDWAAPKPVHKLLQVQEVENEQSD